MPEQAVKQKRGQTRLMMFSSVNTPERLCVSQPKNKTDAVTACRGGERFTQRRVYEVGGPQRRENVYYNMALMNAGVKKLWSGLIRSSYTARFIATPWTVGFICEAECLATRCI